jgi:hypothetical protein
MQHKMKRLFFKIPEYYLILIVALAGYSPSFNIHPIYIILISIFILQIIFKNRISGLILAGLFFLINLYFLAALLSEFSEFTTFNNDAKQLLFVGLSIFIVNLIMATLMVYKYASNSYTNQAKLKLN